MCEGGAGIVPQSVAKGIFRALEIAHLLQNAAQVAVCLGKVRLQLQCPSVAGDCFVQLPLASQRVAQVVVRLGMARIQFQGLAEAGDRFVQVPLFLQRIAQIVVRPGKVRLQFQCPSVTGGRFVRFPLPWKTRPKLNAASAWSGFSSSARRQQARASSGFPWSLKAMPRLACASA